MANEKKPGSARPKDIQWDVDLEPWRGMRLRIETYEGITREGVCTNFSTREFIYHSKSGPFPIVTLASIELDGEGEEAVSAARIEKIEVVG